MEKYRLMFDLDGTLCDPREGIISCLQYALEQLGREKAPEQQLVQYIGPPLYDSFVALLGCNDAALVEQAVGLYRKRFIAKGMFESRLYPQITVALASLTAENHRLLVVTSKPTVFARQIIAHFGIGEFFRNVYGSELNGTRDNKGELIAHVLQQEAIFPAEAVMIGDREQDIKGALANCVFPIGVLWGYGTREELTQAGASALCETPESLPQLFAARSC